MPLPPPPPSPPVQRDCIGELPRVLRCAVYTASAIVPAVRWTAEVKGPVADGPFNLYGYTEPRPGRGYAVHVPMPAAAVADGAHRLYALFSTNHHRSLLVDCREPAHRAGVVRAFVSCLSSALYPRTDRGYTLRELTRLVSCMRLDASRDVRVSFGEELCLWKEGCFFARGEVIGPDRPPCDPTRHDVFFEFDTDRRQLIVTCAPCRSCGLDTFQFRLPYVGDPAHDMTRVVVAYIDRFLRAAAPAAPAATPPRPAQA